MAKRREGIVPYPGRSYIELVITINIIIANIIHFTTSSVLKYIDIAHERTERKEKRNT